MSKQSETVAGVTEPVGNMSIEQLIARRTQARAEPEESAEEELESEQEVDEIEQAEPEDESETEGELEGETEEETEDEEQEEIDLLLSKTPEEIQQLAKKGKSRLLQRIGELTAKNKALEEKQATRGTEAKPLPQPIPAAENPFSDLQTVEAIQAKYSELEKVAEETDRVLEDAEDYGPDDLINFGGKDFTKKEIRTANRNSRNAMLKFLPAQLAEIQKIEARTEMEQNYNAAIPAEIPELADETSDLAKQFASMLADPLIQQVKQRVPDLAPQLGYLLAHALRSINSKSKPPVVRQAAPGTTPRPKVSGNPVGAAAARSTGTPARKQGEQAYQNFEKTGSVEDWIAARAARTV